MKRFNHFLSVVVFFILSFSIGQIFGIYDKFEQNPMTIIKDANLALSVNKNGEMIFYRWVEERAKSCLFYSNTELSGEALNIEEIATSQLLDLGYHPYITPHKYDNGQTISYYFSPKSIDEFGNVLLLFSHEGNTCSKYNVRLSKLAVWNKDYGLKVVEVPGFNDMGSFMTASDNHLFIHCNNNNDGNSIVIISIKDGYWGERKKDEPVNPPKKAETWWDKIKKIFWS